MRLNARSLCTAAEFWKLQAFAGHCCYLFSLLRSVWNRHLQQERIESNGAGMFRHECNPPAVRFPHRGPAFAAGAD